MQKTLKIINQVNKTIDDLSMFNPGDTIIAGISGGSDSIGLLHLLLELDSCSLNIIVAHVNHCLRKAESEKESDFVSKISKKLKLPFEYTEVDTAAYCKHMKLSTENAARELRYNFFFELLEKYSANKIVTAHTLDDQAETVLMRLIRGSGLTGLSGIPPVTKNLARPLIRNPREQVREYLRSKNIEWQEDSSNKSKKFFRNKIRLDLIPLLKSYNPNIVEALFNYAELSRLDQNYINSVAEEEYKKIFKSYEFGLIGDVSTYKSLDKSIRYSLIRHGIKKIKGDLKRFSLKHISKIDYSINNDSTSLTLDLPGNLVVSKGYQKFCIAIKNELSKSYSYSLKSTGKWDLSPGLEINIGVSSDKSLLKKNNVGCFSLKHVSFPIEISSLEPGERFVPYGMKNFKKVKNLLIDNKIPRFLRNKIPVFKSKGEVIWIGGIRVDDRYKVDTNDEKYLKIEIVRPDLTDFFQGV